MFEFQKLCKELKEIHIKLLIKMDVRDTVHSSLFRVPGRISTSQGKQYSTDYMRQNGAVRQIPVL